MRITFDEGGERVAEVQRFTYVRPHEIAVVFKEHETANQEERITIAGGNLDPKIYVKLVNGSCEIHARELPKLVDLANAMRNLR